MNITLDITESPQQLRLQCEHHSRFPSGGAVVAAAA